MSKEMTQTTNPVSIEEIKAAPDRFISGALNYSIGDGVSKGMYKKVAMDSDKLRSAIFKLFESHKTLTLDFVCNAYE